MWSAHNDENGGIVIKIGNRTLMWSAQKDENYYLVRVVWIVDWSQDFWFYHASTELGSFIDNLYCEKVMFDQVCIGNNMIGAPAYQQRWSFISTYMLIIFSWLMFVWSGVHWKAPGAPAWAFNRLCCHRLGQEIWKWVLVKHPKSK